MIILDRCPSVRTPHELDLINTAMLTRYGKDVLGTKLKGAVSMLRLEQEIVELCDTPAGCFPKLGKA
jgi:hypothetical protein